MGKREKEHSEYIHIPRSKMGGFDFDFDVFYHGKEEKKKFGGKGPQQSDRGVEKSEDVMIQMRGHRIPAIEFQPNTPRGERGKRKNTH